jgi:hypothetical protein
MHDQLETYTEAAEGLRTDAAEVPEVLGAVVTRVAELARATADLLADLDDRRANLNAWARGTGLPTVPDPLRGVDASAARLLAAARRGPGEAAVALGKAARRPAVQMVSDPVEGPLPAAAIDDAVPAAMALMAATHHKVYDLDVGELLGGAEPAAVAVVLAGVALQLAAAVVPDMDAWLAGMAADSALAGE